jgi:hypothetical protein
LVGCHQKGTGGRQGEEDKTCGMMVDEAEPGGNKEQEVYGGESIEMTQ